MHTWLTGPNYNMMSRLWGEGQCLDHESSGGTEEKNIP